MKATTDDVARWAGEAATLDNGVLPGPVNPDVPSGDAADFRRRATIPKTSASQTATGKKKKNSDPAVPADSGGDAPKKPNIQRAAGKKRKSSDLAVPEGGVGDGEKKIKKKAIPKIADLEIKSEGNNDFDYETLPPPSKPLGP